MIVSTLLLCGMLLMYLHNLHPQFGKVEEDYKEANAINLSPKTDKQQLSQILIANGYVANQNDADFVADTIIARLKSGMTFSNLYHLQKRDFGQVPASVAEKEGVLTNKLALSYEKLGLIDSLPASNSLDTKMNLNRVGGDGEITVRVYEEKSRGKIRDKIFGAKKTYCKNVIVCLREYYVDSIEHTDVVGYAKTDNRGYAVFSGLDRTHGYSVLPIKKGYEYGSSKGVMRGVFNKHKHFGKKHNFEFKQQEHRIQMLDNLTLKQIKNDGTITVRTPKEFKAKVIVWFVLVLSAWWLLTGVMKLFKRKVDTILMSAGMFLTGLCVIVMFAIHNPLTEDLEGELMASGVLMGIGTIVLLQLVDFVKLYQNQYKLGFDLPLEVLMKLIGILSPFKLGHKKMESAPEGIGWLVLALLLTGLLFFFGNDVGGMKVNLALPGLPVFQPSELVKYLILFFIAAFFTQKADFIVAYSQPNIKRFERKVKTLGWVIGGLVLLMVLYLFLGDMGPALVISVTFILLYSLVKSKVNLDHLTKDEKMRKIFTCDFAMLIYGAASFAIFIIVGHFLGGLIVSLLFACLWFIGWVIFGKFYLKQVVESALIFNVLVSIFVFGGVVIKNIDNDLGERFEQRTSMCVNTWGDLDVNPDNPNYEHGKNAKPVSNTQVANGLWAMATGGFAGQGLGDGNPNLTPAFQTDMIFSSIAEQIGWFGLLLVVAAFTLLLWRIVVIGYKSGNLFAFFLCMGMAIVMAVQFFIIALGSSGIIPLTGITVPYLSYGRVSMIINLAALGGVLSLSQNIDQGQLTDTQQRIRNQSVGEYNYTSGIVKYAYIAIALFTLVVWAHYSWGCFARNKTLVQPVYVLSKEGLPVIEYNPRIEQLIKAMRVGDIYDRNGVLLATSDKNKLNENPVRERLKKSGVNEKSIDTLIQTQAKRYYPFAEHLFFMIGDQNTGLLSVQNVNNPIGYMAEVRHSSLLHGYNNPYASTKKVTLYSDKVKSTSRYSNYYKQATITYQLLDYQVLVKYLKKGGFNKKTRKYDKKNQSGNNDLYLTLDAALQTDMQKRMQMYVQQNKNLNNNHLLRISVVVLDAENGDLLTSANYPLPDYQRLREELSQGHFAYSDNYKSKNWRAYTDRDLGLTYQTMPGSTAKVMSAMAGLQELGLAAASKTYYITSSDIIERGRVSEPHDRNVTMRDAVVFSSNCYFIHIVNENDLYGALDSIYEASGVGIGNTTPYFFINEISEEKRNLFREKMHQNRSIALAKYLKRMNEGVHRNMNEGEWRWAWGQGYENYELLASPLNMARVASAVVNRGKMPHTQYVLPLEHCTEQLRDEKAVRLLSTNSAELLQRYMSDESMNQSRRQKPAVELPSCVGGKTGTPERYHYITQFKRETLNDGWYVFFVKGQDEKHSLAVCVRMERCSGSGDAVRLTQSVVLESLYANGYINR